MTWCRISTVTFAMIVFGNFFSCSGAAFLLSVLTTESISLLLTVVDVSFMPSVSGAQPSLPELKQVFGVFFGRLMSALWYCSLQRRRILLGRLEDFRSTLRFYDLSWSRVREYSFDLTTLCSLIPFSSWIFVQHPFRTVAAPWILHCSLVCTQENTWHKQH